LPPIGVSSNACSLTDQPEKCQAQFRQAALNPTPWSVNERRSAFTSRKAKSQLKNGLILQKNGLILQRR